MRRTASATKPERHGLGGFVLVIAACGVGFAGGGLALVAAVWLLPSLLGFWVERSSGRPAARAMALCGTAASWPALLALWNAGGGLPLGLAVLSDPAPTARSWCAQAAAWLLAECIPVLLVLRVDSNGRRELQRLKDERRDLSQEWALPDPDTADRQS